jgi:hypothetical protein
MIEPEPMDAAEEHMWIEEVLDCREVLMKRTGGFCAGRGGAGA